MTVRSPQHALYSLKTDAERAVRCIEIKVKKAIRAGALGVNKSFVRGSGFDFDQLRDYQPGDDVRFIDWKSVGRLETVAVREYRDDRSRVVMVLVDMSRSAFFSSSSVYKPDIIRSMGIILALLGHYNGDKVGLQIFSDREELYISPATGRVHINRIIANLINYQPNGIKTAFQVCRDRIMKLRRRDVYTFLISDGIAYDGFDELALVARACNLTFIRCLDVTEKRVPVGGFIECIDPETGHLQLVDLRNSSASRISAFLGHRLLEQDKMLVGMGVPCLSVDSDSNIIRDTIGFFKRTVI